MARTGHTRLNRFTPDIGGKDSAALQPECHNACDRIPGHSPTDAVQALHELRSSDAGKNENQFGYKVWVHGDGGIMTLRRGSGTSSKGSARYGSFEAGDRR